jgi:NAD(P)-dependent dehydrogenase (short-subunit alcohol dehydrogenase family)
MTWNWVYKNPFRFTSNVVFQDQSYNQTSRPTFTSTIPAMSAPLIALVTGANAGIGYQVALQLAQVKGAYSYRVITGARSQEKADGAVAALAKEDASLAKDKFFPLVIDLDSDSSIEAAFKTVEKEFGVVDLLVNNAAIAKGSGSTVREEYNAILNTNVTATHIVTQTFLPLLKKSKAPETPGTRIVNVSSGLGSFERTIRIGVQEWTMPYSVSKTALNMLSVYQKDLLKQQGAKIGVVLVCPGYTATKLNNFSGTKTTEEAAKSVLDGAIGGKTWEEYNGKYLSDPGKFYEW